MLQIMAMLADLRDVDYRHTLALSTLIELLVEKGVITREEFAAKSLQLDRESLSASLSSSSSSR